MDRPWGSSVDFSRYARNPRRPIQVFLVLAEVLRLCLLGLREHQHRGRHMSTTPPSRVSQTNLLRYVL